MSPVQAVGKFYDGLSGTSHEVMVGASALGLQIKAVDGSFKHLWPLDDIKVLEEAHDPLPAKLTSKNLPDARLIINPDTGWLRIRDQLPKEAFPKVSLPISWVSFIGYAGLAVATIVFMVFTSPKWLEYGSYLIPLSVEEALGKHVADYVISDPICVEEKGRAALDKMMGRLTAHTTRDIAYKVSVVDNEHVLNAFAAPGGYLILLDRVIQEAESPDEVAGVLGHEMAHIELRHPTRGLVRDVGLSMTLSMMFGGTDVAQLAGNLSTLRYSREDEEEADRVGQEILIKAGVDSSGMVTFFERLAAEEKAEGEEEGEEEHELPEWFSYLSTHPETATRIEKIKAGVDQSSKHTPVLSAQEWQDLKNICEKTESFK